MKLLLKWFPTQALPLSRGLASVADCSQARVCWIHSLLSNNAQSSYVGVCWISGRVSGWMDG